MSKSIDLDNMQESDFQYIKERPWLIEEAEQIGYVVDLKNNTCVSKNADKADKADKAEQPKASQESTEEIVAQVDGGDEDLQGYSDEPIEYSDLTVAELREELKDRDLPIDGKKDELVMRLEEDDEVG